MTPEDRSAVHSAWAKHHGALRRAKKRAARHSDSGCGYKWVPGFGYVLAAFEKPYRIEFAGKQLVVPELDDTLPDTKPAAVDTSRLVVHPADPEVLPERRGRGRPKGKRKMVWGDIMGEWT